MPALEETGYGLLDSMLKDSKNEGDLSNFRKTPGSAGVAVEV
jgi:hypothetical protein